MPYVHFYSPKFSSLAKCYVWPWAMRLRVSLFKTTLTHSRGNFEEGI